MLERVGGGGCESMGKSEAIKNVALILLSAAFSLAIIETFLAWKPELQARRPSDHVVFCGGPSRVVESHATFGWTAAPGSAYFAQKSEADGWQVYIHNTEGFRDIYSSGRRNVIVLGDSFTAGSNADNDEAFPHLLDLWDEDMAFHNFGTGGYGTGNSLSVYEAVASKMPHDLVILTYFLGNDLRDNLIYHDLPAAKEEHPSKLYRILKRINSEMRQLSRTYNLLYAVVRHELGERDLSPEEIESGIRITDDMMAKLVQQVLTNGADLLIVVLPSWNQIKGYVDPEEEQTQRALIQKHDDAWDRIYMLDTTQEIERLGIEPIYGVVDKHFGPFGYYTTAKLIHEWIHSKWPRGDGGGSPVPAYRARAAAIEPDCAAIAEYREAFAHPVRGRETAEHRVARQASSGAGDLAADRRWP